MQVIGDFGQGHLRVEEMSPEGCVEVRMESEMETMKTTVSRAHCVI